MTIDQWLVIDEKYRPKTMRKWISRAKNIYQDVPVKVWLKTKDTDLLYCGNCGAMPEVAVGTDDRRDDMACLVCFKNTNSANEFLV